jgi:hypothetical protein
MTSSWEFLQSLDKRWMQPSGLTRVAMKAYLGQMFLRLSLVGALDGTKVVSLLMSLLFVFYAAYYGIQTQLLLSGDGNLIEREYVISLIAGARDHRHMAGKLGKPVGPR